MHEWSEWTLSGAVGDEIIQCRSLFPHTILNCFTIITDCLACRQHIKNPGYIAIAHMNVCATGVSVVCT